MMARRTGRDMKDYAQIITKMTNTPWLITPEALGLICKIVDERITNGRLDNTELDARLAGIGARDNDDEYGPQVYNGVGVLSLAGPIFGKANLMTQMSGATSLEAFRSQFNELLQNDAVHSIVLDMDTPGGTSDLVQETGEDIFASRSVKPTYAIANTMIGSAGLWLASQATKMYSTTSGAVGSLGAYTVHQDVSGADAQAGHKFTYISAGAHKTEGNPHEPLSPEAIEYRQEVIDELYGDFVNAVATGRGTSTQVVKDTYGGGRMLTAKKALDAGMIDGIMPFDSLIGQLQQSQPRSVSVVVGDKAYAAIQHGTNVFLEVAEWEHSEPGTGSPPVPLDSTTQADRSGDNKGSGSRRDTPPIINPNSDTVTNNLQATPEHGEEVLQMALTLNKASLDRLGLSADATDEQVDAAISALASVNSNSIADLSFQEQFPEQHAELQAARTGRLAANGQVFANEYKFFTKGIGEEVSVTTKGLSALALDKVKNTHMLIAMGATDEALEAFAGAMKILTSESGAVQYGEVGSSRPLVEGDANNTTPTNDKDKTAKWQFMEAVKATQLSAGGDSAMSWGDAVSLTTKNCPDLALSYQQEMANNRSNNS